MAELEPCETVGEENEEDEFPSEATYMEELVQELCDSALEQQTQPPILMEKPIVRIGSFGRNQSGLGFGAGGVRGTGVVHSVYASDRRGYRVDFGPPNRVPLIKPAAPSGRVRGFEEQNQNWNPVLPARGMVNGTGVFLPRMYIQPPPMQERSKYALTDFKHEENQNRMPVAVKKSGKKSKKKKPVAVGGVKATTELELGLPQEWTY